MGTIGFGKFEEPVLLDPSLGTGAGLRGAARRAKKPSQPVGRTAEIRLHIHLLENFIDAAEMFSVASARHPEEIGPDGGIVSKGNEVWGRDVHKQRGLKAGDATVFRFGEVAHAGM
jgi:hypothetical protein